MPCIILTGHPCSGKTALAHKIRDHAIDRFQIRNVVIICEETACPGQSMQECYETSLSEKKTRGALKSAFDRAVAAKSKNDESTLIILDSLNYIKGFRYELFCISKAAGEKHCVVWCLLRQNEPNGLYTKELFNELRKRFEPPDERNRWDKPLYRISTEQTATSVLDQSVYNMHNLAETIGCESIVSSSIDETINKQALKVKKRTSAFKRAKATSSKPVAAAAVTQSETPHQSLTAEALLSHEKRVQNVGDSGVMKQPHVEETPVGTCQQSKQDTTNTSLDDQVDAMLNSFLNNVRKLKEGASTRQHIRTDANLMHKINSIISGEGDVNVRQQFLSWVAVHPPPDPTESGIRSSFIEFSNTAISDKSPP